MNGGGSALKSLMDNNILLVESLKNRSLGGLAHFAGQYRGTLSFNIQFVSTVKTYRTFDFDENGQFAFYPYFLEVNGSYKLSLLQSTGSGGGAGQQQNGGRGNGGLNFMNAASSGQTELPSMFGYGGAVVIRSSWM